MKRLQILFFSITILFSCTNENTEIEGTAFLPLPNEVPLNLTEGYALNQYSEDSISVIINSAGDEILTGKVQRYESKKWEAEDKSIPPIYSLEAPENIALKSNFNASGIPITKWLSIDSVPCFEPSLATDTLVITFKKDTFLTGAPFQLIPKITKAIHTKPIKISDFKTKDNAFYNLGYLNLNEGLSSSYIYAGIQDKRGNYWFGTYGEGIMKFNGIEIVNYSISEGLAGNHVRSMVEDKEGNIWIGTEGGGLCMFDGEKFHTYNREIGLPSDIIYFLTLDNEGNVWAGTSQGGALKYDGINFTCFTKKEGLGTNTIWSILQTKDGDYWFGNDCGGVSRFDGIDFWTYKIGDGSCSETVLSMLEDQNEIIWWGTSSEGLTQLIRKEDSIGFKNYKEGNGATTSPILSIKKDSKDRIWMTTWGSGILMHDQSLPKDGFLTLSSADGLTKDKLWFTLEDQNGDYWFGTEAGGVNKLVYPSFTQYSQNNGLQGDMVWDVMSSKNGDLWFSVFGKGVNQLLKDDLGDEINFFEESEEFSANLIISIAEDLEGNLWFATWGDGLLKYTKTTDQTPATVQQFKTEDGLVWNYLFTVFTAQNGDVWTGAPDKGVTRITKGEDGYDFYHYTDQNGIPGERIRTIAQDNEGKMWFGSDEGGLTCLDLKEDNSYTALTYTTREGLPSNTIRSLHIDKKGMIWMGTNGDGLVSFDGNDFVQYTTEQGLSNEKIRSITESKNGELWVGTALGLNLVTLKEGKVDQIIAYTTKDGLKGQDFLLNSATIDKNNQFWAGTGTDFLRLDLNTLKLKNQTPEVQLTGLEINEEFYDYKNTVDSDGFFTFDTVEIWTNYPKNLELSHTSNNLSFHFNTRNGGPKHKLKYQFTLVGNDIGWNSPTAENKAVYRGLSAGDYTFYVKAIGESGNWSVPFSYSFYIHPPWWKSVWAYFFYGFVLLFLFYAFYRIQLTRRLKIQEANQQIELSNLKTKFFTNISHEFRTPLTLIKGMTDQLKSKVENTEIQKDIEVLERNSNHLLSTVNQLLELSKLDARKKKMQLEPVNLVTYIDQYIGAYTALMKSKNLILSYDYQYPSVVIESDKIALGQIIQNLIGNAVKFTSAGTVKIAVKIGNNREAILEVSDTGIGISDLQLPHVFDRFYQADDELSRSYEGTGIGLSLTKELVELLNGSIEVKSQLGEGTTFKVTFPNAELIDFSTVIKADVMPVSEVKKETLPLANEQEKPLLLIVEDNLDVCYFIKGLLKEKYQIVTAENGEEGAKLAIENVPDFIIADWMMPVKTGPEMIQELKVNSITSHIPIMLLTARADQQSKLSGYKYGAEAYLTKPFEAEELILRIKALIDARNAIRIRYEQKLVTHHTETNKPLETRQALTPNLNDLFIQKTIEIIAEKLEYSELNGEWLASQHHLSRSQFARKLKAITGKSITEFIRDKRLDAAKKLLLIGELTVSEIAYEVGFSDPAYFSRVFTKEVGVSPSTFKEG